MADDYCDLCDLPLSTCVHGMPAPVAPPAPSRSTSGSTSRATARKAPAKPKPARRVSTTTPARPRKWTPPEVLGPHILDVLLEAGGELEADDVFERLEERLADTLLAGDRERTPEGELRWRYAARRARQALIAEGAMARSRPGVWELAADV